MPARISPAATGVGDQRAGVWAQPSRTVLSRLGLFGLDRIEPVILAALATEEPLLLVGAHGTGKSLLLVRIGEALGLDVRHYNASLLNFDDLVGFPLPNGKGGLDYVRTPASVWGAGAVIFDEISRCRPDIQNKLFPIIHERRVQGLLLESLRYRWAAMNPPAGDEDEEDYLGAEPLDPALADRFPFIVEMPTWESLSEADQIAIILAETKPSDPGAPAVLVARIAGVRTAIEALREVMGPQVADYVRTLTALLAQAGLRLSPRRAGMLLRSVLAVHAAAETLETDPEPAESALLAVSCGLPQRAQGIKIPETRVLAAHKEAWRLTGFQPDDPIRRIITASDPVERVRLATRTQRIAKGEFSTIIADALAQLPPGAREAVVVHLFETGAVGRLNAAIAEQAAGIYGDVAQQHNFSESLPRSSIRYETWERIRNILARLDPDDARAHLAANALAATFSRKELATPKDAERMFAAWTATDARLVGGGA